MGTSGKFRRTRQGFTLIELLVVIVIIGILAASITAAAINARGMVKRKAVLAEIGQIDIALQRYKTEFGEYPPDFIGVDDGLAGDSAIELAARDRVLRHLRKRFPRYRPRGIAMLPTPWLRFCYDVKVNYNDGVTSIDPSQFDAASGLVFWLGGLPETAPADPWIPRGFHSDPTFPFQQGSPRTDSFYPFDPERLVVIDPTDPTKQLRYIPRYIEAAPLVYFKAVRSAVNGRFEYGTVVNTAADPDFLLLSFVDTNSPDPSICVPYVEDLPALVGAVWVRNWESPERYQIICSGMDSLFGDRLPFELATPTVANFRVTSKGIGFSEDEGDYDNLTSFSTSKLEVGIE
jgi:prepilin-type N-terminal cleavage/methylation domain-containing protein